MRFQTELKVGLGTALVAFGMGVSAPAQAGLEPTRRGVFIADQPGVTQEVVTEVGDLTVDEQNRAALKLKATGREFLIRFNYLESGFYEDLVDPVVNRERAERFRRFLQNDRSRRYVLVIQSPEVQVPSSSSEQRVYVWDREARKRFFIADFIDKMIQ
jgi:hypothetical protein